MGGLALSSIPAIADGFQVEVTKIVQEAEIRFPMFLTRAVFDNYVTVPEGVTGLEKPDAFEMLSG